MLVGCVGEVDNECVVHHGAAALGDRFELLNRIGHFLHALASDGRVTLRSQLPSESGISAMTNAVSINHSAVVAFEDFARMTGDADPIRSRTGGNGGDIAQPRDKTTDGDVELCFQFIKNACRPWFGGLEVERLRRLWVQHGRGLGDLRTNGRQLGLAGLHALECLQVAIEFFLFRTVEPDLHPLDVVGHKFE